MGCGSSVVTAPPEVQNHPEPARPSVPPSRPVTVGPGWKEGRPVTRHELKQKRDEYWHTRVEGNMTMWQTLKIACESLLEGEVDTANAILEASNIATPNGDLSVCYDELGFAYKVPEYLYSDPLDISNSPQEASMKNKLFVDEVDPNAKPKMLNLRLRMAPEETLYKIALPSNATIYALKTELVKAMTPPPAKTPTNANANKEEDEEDSEDGGTVAAEVEVSDDLGAKDENIGLKDLTNDGTGARNRRKGSTTFQDEDNVEATTMESVAEAKGDPTSQPTPRGVPTSPDDAAKEEENEVRGTGRDSGIKGKDENKQEDGDRIGEAKDDERPEDAVKEDVNIATKSEDKKKRKKKTKKSKVSPSNGGETDEKNEDQPAGKVREIIPVERQRVIWWGRELPDDKTLAQARITNGSIVQVYPRPIITKAVTSTSN